MWPFKACFTKNFVAWKRLIWSVKVAPAPAPQKCGFEIMYTYIMAESSITPLIDPVASVDETYVRDIVGVMQQVMDLALSSQPKMDFTLIVPGLAFLVSDQIQTQIEYVEVYCRHPEKTLRRKTLRCGDFQIHFDPIDCVFEMQPWGEFLDRVAQDRLGCNSSDTAVEIRPLRPLVSLDPGKGAMGTWGDFMAPVHSYVQGIQLESCTPKTGATIPGRRL